MIAYKLTRSGALNPDGTMFAAAAGIFASAIVAGTTLLTTRDDNGFSHYVLAPELKKAEQSAKHLAHAVAARADLALKMPDLTQVNHVAWLTTERHPALISRDTQAGIDPGSVSRALAISMPPGQWAAVVLRKPTRKEKAWGKTWLERTVTPCAFRGELALLPGDALIPNARAPFSGDARTSATKSPRRLRNRLARPAPIGAAWLGQRSRRGPQRCPVLPISGCVALP